VSGVTGVVSCAVLGVLQHFVWTHGEVPSEVTAFVWLTVPYTLSQLSGRIVRRILHRRTPLTACVCAPQPPTVPIPPQRPASP
jgi:hypothetical protein